MVTNSAPWRSARALLLAGALLLSGPSNGGQLSPYTEPGAEAPAFTLKAPDGEPHRLKDYRGKVVLVNFWASWCPPCLAEMPGMQRLANRMPAETFQILAVNVGESAFRVAKFMKLIGVHFTALLDDKGEVFEAWGGSIYPTSFVLDGEGRIRYFVYGPLDWDSEAVFKTLLDLLPSRQGAAG
jgi:peroxiredoxin